MKKIWFITCNLFVILTFIGSGYVLLTKGQASPGYAVVPMLFALIFGSAYRKKYNNKH